MNIFQRGLGCHDVVGRRVHRQMQFAPDPALVMAMLSDLPFALAKHFQAGGIDNQIGHLALGWLAVCHLHGAGALADTAVVGGTQRHIHQLKQRVEQALCRPQGEVENALEHEKGTDGLVGVEGASSPPAMMFLMEPVMNDMLINPER